MFTIQKNKSRPRQTNKIGLQEINFINEQSRYIDTKISENHNQQTCSSSKNNALEFINNIYIFEKTRKNISQIALVAFII